jgi:hypothetical protein
MAESLNIFIPFYDYDLKINEKLNVNLMSLKKKEFLLSFSIFIF